MIVSYLIYDIHTLLACSMTCHSWYIAAVPHLHHSLTVADEVLPLRNRELLWPTPLQNSYELGLLPLVKRFYIHRKRPKLTLESHILRYLPAFTNLQELGIGFLQLPSFMRDIRQCFGHFAPTLRFLALREPVGSCRQILYFIGLFPNLQDLNLCYDLPPKEEESTAGEELIPLSTPPLHGRLTLMCFTREKLMKDMITLFGGLRFRHVDLFKVNCAQLILGACAETLETLRLYSMDSPREELLLKERKPAQVHDP